MERVLETETACWDLLVCLHEESWGLSTLAVLIKTNPTNYGEQNESDATKVIVLTLFHAVLLPFMHSDSDTKQTHTLAELNRMLQYIQCKCLPMMHCLPMNKLQVQLSPRKINPRISLECVCVCGCGSACVSMHGHKTCGTCKQLFCGSWSTRVCFQHLQFQWIPQSLLLLSI